MQVQHIRHIVLTVRIRQLLITEVTYLTHQHVLIQIIHLQLTAAIQATPTVITPAQPTAVIVQVHIPMIPLQAHLTIHIQMHLIILIQVIPLIPIRLHIQILITVWPETMRDQQLRQQAR